ncbi:MAG: hypothetical protein ABIH42_07025 [Planctomycetota bacterium]
MTGNLVITDDAVTKTQLEFKAAERRLLCAIVLTKSGVINASPLAKIISRLRSVPYTYALVRLLQGSGVIMRDASREEVAEVGGELDKQGFTYILIPTKELLQPPRVISVRNVSVSEVSLSFVTRREESFSVSWNDFLTITCGCVEREKDRTRWEEVEYVSDAARGKNIIETPSRRLIIGFMLSSGMSSLQFECNLVDEQLYDSQFENTAKHPFEKIGKIIYKMYNKQAQNKGMRRLAYSGIKGPWNKLSFQTTDQLREYNLWLAVLRKYQVNVIGMKHSGFSILALVQPEFTIEEAVVPAPKPAPVPIPVPAQKQEAVFEIPVGQEEAPVLPDASGILMEHSTLITISASVAVVLLLIWIILLLIG